jgi:hypothetical protein
MKKTIAFFVFIFLSLRIEAQNICSVANDRGTIKHSFL